MHIFGEAFVRRCHPWCRHLIYKSYSKQMWVIPCTQIQLFSQIYVLNTACTAQLNICNTLKRHRKPGAKSFRHNTALPNS